MFQCTVEPHPTRAPLPRTASQWRLAPKVLLSPHPPPPATTTLVVTPTSSFIICSTFPCSSLLPFTLPFLVTCAHPLLFFRSASSPPRSTLQLRRCWSLAPLGGRPKPAMEPSGAEHDATSQSSRHGDDAQQQAPDGKSQTLESDSLMAPLTSCRGVSSR